MTPSFTGYPPPTWNHGGETGAPVEMWFPCATDPLGYRNAIMSKNWGCPSGIAAYEHMSQFRGIALYDNNIDEPVRRILVPVH
jgi:hypothetical protein